MFLLWCRVHHFSGAPFCTSFVDTECERKSLRDFYSVECDDGNDDDNDTNNISKLVHTLAPKNTNKSACTQTAITIPYEWQIWLFVSYCASRAYVPCKINIIISICSCTRIYFEINDKTNGTLQNVSVCVCYFTLVDTFQSSPDGMHDKTTNRSKDIVAV